jgi:putative ABC transport system permease protein
MSMKTTIYTIEFVDLLWILIPVGVTLYLYGRWTHDHGSMIMALGRMVLQLLVLGYVLTYIFAASTPWPILAVMAVMLAAASVIALRPLHDKPRRYYLYVLIAIIVGGATTLYIVIVAVLRPDPWYDPKVLIPLAGMIFSNAMNAVSIAAERYEGEVERGQPHAQARSTAYKAAFIPTLNMLYAVGLVSLPGMMTGQILSGVDPLIAVRYQMMVMLMVLGSGGIAVAVYLGLVRERAH